MATKTEHVPIDFELYLSQTWAEDPARRRKARIPDEVVFETKPQLALNMVRWAVEDGLPKGVLLADSAYGDSTAFREGVRGLGLDYAVGVHGPTKVWRLDKLLRRRGEPISVAQLALSLGRNRFRRVTWREGSKQPLWSRFACQRVVPTHDDGWDPAVREDVWLVIDGPTVSPSRRSTSSPRCRRAGPESSSCA